MANKANILKRIGDFIDTEFKTSETPVELAAPPVVPAPAPGKDKTPAAPTPADKPVNELPFKVGEALPDGEYEIDGNVVKLVKGIIEAITPANPNAAPEVPMASNGGTIIKTTTVKEETKMSSEDIKVELSKEFEAKLEAIKADFETQLKKLSEAKQTSGIIQAPVEVKTEPKVYSAKEIIMRNIAR